MPRASHRWSADDIIREYPQLGIPHFQRGLVWGEESVSLLLESLYYGTPCGELVLWRPRYPTREGIPLDPSTPPRHLVIDGQQRIRSVWDALAVTENAADLDMENSAEADGREIWCLNLCKVPELRNHFDGNDDFPLFRLLRDPLDPKVRSRYKHNLVPLACFLKDRPLEEYFGLLKVKKDEDLLAVRKDIEGLRSRVQQLYTQCVFSVTTLVERNGKHTLSDVVALYNRINSGGMRVEPEERAFATLVALRPTETSTWLRDLFKKIHNADESPERDDILKRQKERSFGFKLFMRTFVQVCAYHFGYSVGSSSFSFSVVEGTGFQKRLKESKQSVEIFNRTTRILLYLRKRLEELYCDDLRTLPETTALLPVFQLLIRYPGLMDDDEVCPIVRSLIFRLLLVPAKDQRDILMLVSGINKSQTAERCLGELLRLHATLAPGDDFGGFLKRIETSQSLQDRYVLMLYWLVRRMKARDLSYENLTPDRRQLMLDKYGSEVEISVAVRPQKQHIVPYSWLRAVYGVTERGRLVYHPINNIGNLTYISAALNDIETGLGAEPFRYDQEPRDNLERHFLANRDNDDLRLHYHSAIQNDGKDKDLLRESYEDFCDVRRKLIAHGFADWLREETPSWHLDRRIRPDKRMFTDSPFDDDLIRELKYPSELEDVLLARVEDPKFRLDKRRSDKQMALVNLRDDSKDAVLELKLLKNRIEISAKKPAGMGYMSRLTAASSLRTISQGQWHLRVDSKQPAAAVSVLSSLLDAVLDAKP